MKVYDFNAETESLLLANDSTITHVRLYQKMSKLSWLETIQQFSRAFAKNTVIDHLYIDVREIVQMSPSNGLELLLQTVEESSCIKNIVIENGFRLNNESRAFGSAILSSISRNRNIKSCQFDNVWLHSQDLSTLLRNTSSTALLFERSTVDFGINGEADAPGFNENVQEVKDAFEQNKSLNKLFFQWTPMISENNRIILEAARQNTSITDLIIVFEKVSDGQYNPEILADVATYVNESKLNSVGLTGMKWDNATFGAFSSHISREGDPIEYFLFDDCSFDNNSSRLLKYFLVGHQNYKIIGLGFSGNETMFHDDINLLGEIISKENGPKILWLKDYSGISSPKNGLESICTGLASKTTELENLILPCLSPTQLDYLLDKVPTFKNIQGLALTLNEESEFLKGKLFSSFCRNGCLNNLKVEAPWMTGRDSHMLHRFCLRNNILQDLVGNVPKGLKLPPSTIPVLFKLSSNVTSVNGPKDIVAMLTTLGDEICNPDQDNFSSSKQLRMG